MKHRILLFFAVAIPLALFMVARNAASWRPQLVHQSASQSETFLLSPSARWMLCGSELSNEKTMIDLRANRSTEWVMRGSLLKFTADENAVFFQFTDSSRSFISVYELPSGKLRQSFEMPRQLSWIEDAQFTSDATRFIAVTDYVIVSWDAKTGQLLSQRSYNFGYRPPPICKTPVSYLSFGAARGEGALSEDGSSVNGGDKTFSTATGEIVTTQISQPSTSPRSSFDVNQGQNFIRVTDRKSGEVVLLEDSLESHYSADERWLLNVESKGVIQLIDAKSWKVVSRP